jgi:hypothetical protein
MASITNIGDEPSTARTGNASAADLHRAATARHAMLLEGPEPSVEAVLMLLAPYLRKPVTWKRCGAPLELPAGEVGTLVLENITGLDTQDQARLLVWLNEPTRRAQVVSTTAYPLFPLVCCQAFDATLYYRLNVVRFSLDPE